MQCTCDSPIRVAFVLAEMTLLHESTAFGNPAAAQVGVIGVNADPVRSQVLEYKIQCLPDGFADEAFPIVVHVHDIPKDELGQIPTQRPLLSL